MCACRAPSQLGYLVQLSVRYDHGAFGLKVSVQSASHPPEYLDERIEAFLQSVPALLDELPPSQYANHRDALVTGRLAPPYAHRASNRRLALL